MSKSTRWLIGLALTGSAALLLWLAVFDWAAWACRQPAGEAGKPLAPGPIGCGEFWLNRYQTLIGAIVAIAAAAAAWVAVRRQIDVARHQIKVMTGDLDPDFSIDQVAFNRHSTVTNTVLKVVNLNRRDLIIRRVEVISPPAAQAMLSRVGSEPNTHKVVGGRDNRVFDIISRVSGTHPTASESSGAEFVLGLVNIENERTNGEHQAGIRLHVKVQYEILGRSAERGAAEVMCDLGTR